MGYQPRATNDVGGRTMLSCVGPVNACFKSGLPNEIDGSTQLLFCADAKSVHKLCLLGQAGSGTVREEARRSNSWAHCWGHSRS